MTRQLYCAIIGDINRFRFVDVVWWIFRRCDRPSAGCAFRIPPAAAQIAGEVPDSAICFTFVLTGNYTAVAFALTAKSIARFKELDNKDFAEHFLLGTSTRVGIALLAGSLVQLFL